MASKTATLVVGPSWVGDMVMAQSLFRLLHEQSPERPIDVLAPEWSLPIVARMPEVRNGIAAKTAHGEIGFSKRRQIAKQLRGRYDHAIVLPRSLKAALIPWLAGVPKRTGFRGESRYFLINDMRRFDRRLLDQTVKRYLALGQSADATLVATSDYFPRLHVDVENQARVTEALGLITAQPVIGMMPGAEYGPAKCWPLPQFTALATSLREEGYSVWIFGSDKDAAAGETIAKDNGAENLCGRTSLADVIDLLALCEQVVSNDSGLMHIAAAVGTRVHGIYGSSSPAFTPPLTHRSDIHHLALDCSPCFKRVCPLGHLRCLTDISPAMVLSRILAKSA